MTLNAREKEIKTGWTIVAGILGVILFFSLVRLLLPLLAGMAPSVGGGVSFLLNLGLCWMVYQGRNWARFLLVALLLLGGIMSLIGGVMLGGGFGAFVMVISLLNLGAGISLFAVPAVNRYFEYVNS